MAGPTLLKAYRTPPGTDEASPRTVTFDVASHAGTTLIAIIPSSSTPSLNSPWTAIATGSGGTICKVFKLAAADNPGGITSVTVTQSGAYPFSLLIFEDYISSISSSPTPGQTLPSGTSWSAGTATFATGHRVVAYWNVLKYQLPSDGDITAYSLGMAEIGDTDISSEYNGSHVKWYTCRTWAAWVDDLSGSQTLNATETITVYDGAWTGYIYYVTSLPPFTIPTATASVAAYAPAVLIPLLLTVPTAAVSVAAYAPAITIPTPLLLTVPTADVTVGAYVPTLGLPLTAFSVPTAHVTVSARPVSLAGPLIPNAVQVVTMGGAQPTDVKNVVTIGRADIPTDPVTEAPPPTTVRHEGSIARYRAKRYERTDLTHDDDLWSEIVAVALIGVDAFPSAAPRSITLDSRQHPLEGVPEILLSVEPDMALNIYDRANHPWTELVAGWEVQVGLGHIEGTITLNDVTDWADSAEWDVDLWDDGLWAFLTTTTLRKRFPWPRGE